MPKKVSELLPGQAFKTLNCRENKIYGKVVLTDALAENAPVGWKDCLALDPATGQVTKFTNETIQCAEVESELVVAGWR
jgi:hypothetical protein